MIPLKDSVPLRTYPFVTVILVQLNLLGFVLELTQGPEVYDFLLRFATVPTRVLNWPSDPFALLTLFTSQFLHAGWFHLIGNMIYLWIFGRKVEGAMGPWRFLGFYLLSGALADMLHVVFSHYSHIPTVGASGAIAAVLGAYMLLYPKARVWVWVPLVFWLIIPVPALVGLAFWFILQVISGVLSLDFGVSQAGGIAWWAHIGGFLSGLAMGPWLRLPPPTDWRRKQLELSAEGPPQQEEEKK